MEIFQLIGDVSEYGMGATYILRDLEPLCGVKLKSFNYELLREDGPDYSWVPCIRTKEQLLKEHKSYCRNCIKRLKK